VPKLFLTLAALLIVGPAQALDRQGLLLAPGAVDITRQPGKHEAYIVYYVKEYFPASATGEFIKRELERHGWSPVPRAEPLPNLDSSPCSDWEDASDIGRRFWNARWHDAKGNQVNYTLTYAYPRDGGDLQPTYVSVLGLFLDKRNAEQAQLREEVRQREWRHLLYRACGGAKTAPPCRDQ
jgi:hypothetical protein